MIKKILVSQPKPSSEKSPYYDIMRKHNVELEFRPFIKVESLTPREFRAQRINILDHTAIIFSSRHAIDNFFLLCQEMRIEIPEDIKYFCITETISHYIQKYVQYRKRKVFFGDTGKMADLMPQILKHKNEKYFIPQSDVHSTEFTDLLDAKGISYTSGVVYRTVSNDFTEDEAFDYDMLIFFSPSGIQSLLKNFPNYQQGETAIATFGPATAKSVTDAGLRLDLQAPTPEYPSITAALDAYLKQHNG